MSPDDEGVSDQLPPALLQAIALRGATRAFPAQTILINEGDATDSLYIMLSGRVKVYASSDEGRDVVLTEYGPGEYFGELSLDGAKRSASIKAMEPCTCRVVQGSEMRQLLIDYPDFAMHLTRKLIRMVRRLTEQVRSIATEDVYGRMVRVLNELSEQIGHERVLRQKLTQQDIADRVGASREMVNRVMKELTAGGYVTQRNGRLVILRKLPSAW
ncbi:MULTISPECIES: Crp/Fnr family transcriptional regulator [unclassified Variovorax]|uniref:Crp/Fnr family transcriptional regulator n=1 Tax=unclassified Variovorax TaxID=663243 RepID=UPI001BD44422|nr:MULTISPECIES: Crp/Fnr family transcriptional regulator [unclassified Variovorax]